MTELKDWLNSINQNKKNLYEEDPDIKYPAYIVNRCMSGHLDTVLFANEMNLNHHLSKDKVVDFRPAYPRLALHASGAVNANQIHKTPLFSSPQVFQPAN